MSGKMVNVCSEGNTRNVACKCTSVNWEQNCFTKDHEEKRLFADVLKNVVSIFFTKVLMALKVSVRSHKAAVYFRQ
jgi:hypothetical protein